MRNTWAIRHFKRSIVCGIIIFPLALAISFPIIKSIYIYGYLETDGIVLDSVLISTSSSNPTYEASIKYGYRINGNNYLSSDFDFSGNYRSKNSENAQKIIEKYSKGTSIKLFYDKENPNKSVIEKDFTLTFYVLCGAFLFAVALQLHALWADYRIFKYYSKSRLEK